MNPKVLRILEFDKVIQKLQSLASSDLGKEISASLVPDTKIEKVESMLKETSDGVDYILRNGTPSLWGIHDIRVSLKRAAMGISLTPGELLKTADTLGAARSLKSHCKDAIPQSDNVVIDLIGCLRVEKSLEDKIYGAILNEEEISDNASPELAQIRRQIRKAQDSVREKLNEIIRSPRYQKFIQEALVTMRGDRYVIPVKQEHKNEVPGLVHDSSASGATLFVEPMAVVEANNVIKQLKVREQNEIERILAELTEEVRAILPALESNLDILARLDHIFAKAKLSLEYNCVCPKINLNGAIVIRKGRHPLLDPETVVPIDFWIGRTFKTLVITGPNTGGKTVTLKTVGLFTLMAQAGLHIPAMEGTEMSIFKKVFADIGDEQSIEQSLSTFSAHMKNIVGILREADRQSLALFDELGAGTDPAEGAALAMAILNYLHSRGAISVATTHYSELKVYAATTDGVENACCEFDVETLKPTYRLLIGLPGKSNAFTISQRLGLPEAIIENAKEFLSQDDIKFEDLLLNIERSRAQTEKDRIEAENYRREAESLRAEMEMRLKKLEAQREKVLKEAKEKARRILLEATEEASRVIEELRKLKEESLEAGWEKAAQQFRRKLREKLDEVSGREAAPPVPEARAVSPGELKAGTRVMILNLGKEGTVMTPPGEDGEALVQVGIMKVSIHMSNLLPVNEKAESNNEEPGLAGIGASKVKSIFTELDIRGKTLDEALIAVDKYLDDASLAGLKEVLVIHGKGTGVLRKGIHQFLRGNRHVADFRLGSYGEGDAGVTVIRLK